MYNRATTLGEALVNAAVKTPKSNWIQRAIADRAIHTSTGVVQEKDQVHLSFKTAKKLGMVHHE